MRWLIIIVAIFCKVGTVRAQRIDQPKLDTCINYKRLPPAFDLYMEGKTATYEGMRYIWRADSRSDYGDTGKYVGEVLYRAFDSNIDSLFNGLLPSMPIWTDSSDYCWFYTDLNH